MNHGLSFPLKRVIALAERHEREGAPARAARFYAMAARHAARAYVNEDALHFADRALALHGDGDAAERFELLLLRERLHGLLGNVEAQKQDLAALEAVAANLEDDRRRALVAVRQAMLRESSGDYAAAVSLANLATRLAVLAGAPSVEAAARLSLGRSYQQQGHFDSAEIELKRAGSLSREIGEEATVADVLRSLGVLYHDWQRLPAAVEKYEEALSLYRKQNDRYGVALVANNLGHVYAHRGALFAAQKQWNEAQELYREVGDFEGSIRVLVNLGAISTDLGQYDEARKYLEQAQTLAQKVRSLPGQCFSALNLGLVAHRQEQHAAGVEWLRQALSMAEEMGARRLEGAVYTALGHALAGNGQIAEAGDAYWEALAIWSELNLANLSAEAQAGLARIALRNGTPPLAMHFVEQILAQMERDEALEGTESPVAIYLTCYRVLAKMEDARAAEVLENGRRRLMTRLEGLTDEAAREAVLRHIPAHRELLAAAGPG